jgi:hypothetical protein
VAALRYDSESFLPEALIQQAQAALEPYGQHVRPMMEWSSAAVGALLPTIPRVI